MDRPVNLARAAFADTNNPQKPIWIFQYWVRRRSDERRQAPMKTMTTEQFSRGVTRLKHSACEVRMLDFMKKHGGRLLPSRRYGQAMGWKNPTDSANLQFGRLAGPHLGQRRRTEAA
jgi:hypothetical protein